MFQTNPLRLKSPATCEPLQRWPKATRTVQRHGLTFEAFFCFFEVVVCLFFLMFVFFFYLFVKYVNNVFCFKTCLFFVFDIKLLYTVVCLLRCFVGM